jgi:hypothetical protein
VRIHKKIVNWTRKNKYSCSCQLIMETDQGFITKIMINNHNRSATITLHKSPEYLITSEDDSLFSAMVCLCGSAKASGKQVKLSFDTSGYMINTLEILDV